MGLFELMFVEVTHDEAGTILRGWCADTAPVHLNSPLYSGPDPPGCQRCRLDLSLHQTLEIEHAVKQEAAVASQLLMALGQLDAAQTTLASWKTQRMAFIQQHFRVDLTQSRSFHPDLAWPAGMALRPLVLK